MQRKTRWGFHQVALLLTVTLAVSCVANAQQLTWLGTLGGGTSNAYNVSSGGVVVGSAEDAGGRTRAFLWTASTGMQDLGTLGGTTSLAYAVSEDGRVVVGYATDSSGQERAFLWTAVTGHAGSRHAGRNLEQGAECLSRRHLRHRLCDRRQRATVSLPLDGIGRDREPGYVRRRELGVGSFCGWKCRSRLV